MPLRGLLIEDFTDGPQNYACPVRRLQAQSRHLSEFHRKEPAQIDADLRVDSHDLLELMVAEHICFDISGRDARRVGGHLGK